MPVKEDNHEYYNISYSFIPESSVESERTDNNRDKFISIKYIYMPSAGNSRKNNYVLQAKGLETGTPKDVLRWYITLQETFEKKTCKDTMAKFNTVKLLLGGQDKKDFMRFKKTVANGLVAFDSTVSISTPRGITEDSFKLILDKFKN